MKQEVNLHSIYLDRLEEDIEKAKVEFHLAIYLGECGSNAGLRKMWSNRANWLGGIIYLAELQLAEEKRSVHQEMLFTS